MEPSVNVNEVSRISTGTKVKGEISSANDLRIDGTFEGKMYSKGRVVVGEKALIKGDIVCSNVDFWGTMEGNFFVKDTLSLKSSSKVKGDLHIKRLQVELDAKFDGTCQMISEADFDRLVGGASPAKPAAAPAAPQAPSQPAAQSQNK